MTRKDFATKVGVSQPVITDWCSGANLPSRDRIGEVCACFDEPDNVGLATAWVTDGLGPELVSKILRGGDQLPRTIALADEYYDAVTKLVDGMLRSASVREAVLHLSRIVEAPIGDGQ